MTYTPNNIQGWMSEEELIWLYNIAKKMDSIVEVGSWRGRSTHALLSGCKGTVHAVDTFKGNPEETETAHVDAKTQDIHEQFLANVGCFQNLVVYKMDSVEASSLFSPKSIDMVFIDGSHTFEYVSKDINAWLPICKKLLCGHDSRQNGVPQALDSLLVNYKMEVHTIWSYTPKGQL